MIKKMMRRNKYRHCDEALKKPKKQSSLKTLIGSPRQIKIWLAMTFLAISAVLFYPQSSIYAAENVMLAKRSVFDSIFGGSERDTHDYYDDDQDTDSYLPPEETSSADENIQEQLKKVKPLPSTDTPKAKNKGDSIPSETSSTTEQLLPEDDTPQEVKVPSTKQTVILPKAEIRVVNRNSGKTDIIEINNDDFKQYNALQIKLSKCWREDYRDIVNKDSALIEVNTLNAKKTDQDVKSSAQSTGKYWIFTHYPEINTYVSKEYHIFLLSCKD